MLALSRREGEAIIIGGNIRVVVVKVKIDGSVRLGIDAPKHIAIDREEIAELKKRNNQ